MPMLAGKSESFDPQREGSAEAVALRLTESGDVVVQERTVAAWLEVISEQLRELTETFIMFINSDEG